MINNIKIWQKMALILQVMSIPAVILFILFLYSMNRLADIESTIILDNVSSIKASYNLQMAILRLKGLRANFIIDSDRKWLKEFNTRVEDFNFWYNRAFAAAKTEMEKTVLTGMAVDFSGYTRDHKRIVKLVETGRKDLAAKELLGSSARSYESILAACNRLVDINEDLIQNSENQVYGYMRRGKILGYLVIIVFIIIGIILALFISRSISDPIRKIGKKAGVDPPAGVSVSETEVLRLSFDKMNTAIQEKERKLVQSEKRAALGEIAAGISHELNNPIGIICGFSEMLLGREDLKHVQHIVSDIHSEAFRCRKLLGEFLNYSRAPEPVFRVSSLSSLVRKTVTLLKGQKQYESIKFKTIIPSGSHRIRIDAMQMRQVLINLINNARDALSGTGGIIIILETTGTAYRITVSDNGPGIPPDSLEKIFRPFYSTKTGGAGLGLSICRDIVEKNGGEIRAKSEPGIRTEFTITFPKES